MRLEESVQVRFLIKPVPYMAFCHPETKVVTVKQSSGDIYTDLLLLKRGHHLRFRSLVLNSVTKEIQIFDMGMPARSMIGSLEADEVWSDIFKYDICLRIDLKAGPQDCLCVLPKMAKRNPDAEKYVINSDQFIKDVRLGEFSFVANPVWSVTYCCGPDEDIAIYATDGSSYAKLKSEGSHCPSCNVFYPLADSIEKCWTCKNL